MAGVYLYDDGWDVDVPTRNLDPVRGDKVLRSKSTVRTAAFIPGLAYYSTNYSRIISTCLISEIAVAISM